MIIVKNVFKNYGNVAALQGVSLNIEPGTVTGLLGPNGCGKTTLIKGIVGLVVPQRGSIEVLGKNIFSSEVYRDNIGYLPQNPDFPSNLTVTELFDMMEDIRGRPADKKRDLVNSFELDASLSKPFGTLSGGTKQRVAATVAFMFDPSILILDEPSSGLDPVAALSLKALIKSSAENGKTVLLISHVMSEIEHLATKTAFLLGGKIVFEGPIRDLKERTKTSNLEEAVVGLLRIDNVK